MISGLTLARIAAVIAILGFFLPWAEVSCSGEPLSHETGIQLITDGGGGTAAPGHYNLWVAASFALVVIGLAGSLLAGGGRAAAILATAALAAIIASLIGVSQEVPGAEVQAQLAAGPSGGASEGGAGPLLRIRLEYGYFVSLGGLIVTIAASGLALGGQRPALKTTS
jgi:hypothetical protein